MEKLVSSRRIFVVLAIFLAGLCLVRVFTVSADDSPSDSDQDYEEVYSSQRGPSPTSPDGYSENRTIMDAGKADVHISQPEDAALRIVDGRNTRAVPGIEAIRQADANSDELTVPKLVDRKIATLPSDRAIAPVKLKDSAGQELKARSPAEAADAPMYGGGSQERGTMEAANNPGGDIMPATTMQPKPSVMNPGGAESGQEVSVIVSDSGFYPARIVVTQGIPVHVYMSTPSKDTLCFMLDKWNVRKGVGPGKVEEFSFTPDQPGKYRFYCPVKSLEGSLIVHDAPPRMEAGRGVASDGAPVGFGSDPATAANADLGWQGDAGAGQGNEPKNAEVVRTLFDDNN